VQIFLEEEAARAEEEEDEKKKSFTHKTEKNYSWTQDDENHDSPLK